MKKNLHGNRFAAVAADGAVDWDHPLNAKRIAWYLNLPGIPARGNRLLDLCGKNHGTLVGYSSTANPWTPTKRGDVGLNGALGTETVTTTGNILFNASAMTVSCWVLTTNAAFNGSTFAINDGGGSGNQWQLTSDGNAAPVFQLQKVIAFSSTTISSDATWTDNAWYHVMATVREDGTMKMWINGAPQSGTGTASTGVFPDTTGTTLYLVGSSRDLFQASTSLWGRGFTDSDAAAQYYFDLGNYFSVDSPLRWMSTRTWFVAATGITFDAASNSTYQAAASTYSWSHTCTGSNRYLAVDISILSVGGTVTGITYNGVAMSAVTGASISTVSSLGRIECWGLANPASGSNTIAVTLSGSIASIGTATSYAGVHQTSPTEAGNAAQATNVGAADATVSVTTVAVNDWVHGALVTNDTAVTANQTSRNNVSQVAVGSGADADTGPVASPGSTALGWTDVGAAQTWAVGAYAIRPVGSSSLVVFNPYDIEHSPQHQAVMAM